MIKDSSQEAYLWQAPGKPLSICLDYDVMDRLNADVMRGFGAVRRRGAEVGGILLGSIQTGDRVTVHVRDFQAVPCEYSQGPSYVLSETDLAGFRTAVDSHQPASNKTLYAVGFYRSHTRDGLFLDATDLILFREYFEESSNVALLIKPYATKPSVAGFFVPEGGVMNGAATSGEFVFRRPASSSDGARPKRPAPVPFPEPTRPEATIPADAPKREIAVTAAIARNPEVLVHRPESRDSREPAPLFSYYQPPPSPPMWRVRLALLCFSAVLVAFGGILGFQFGSGKLGPSTVSSATDPYALGLVTTRNGESVNLNWDKTSQAVRSASRGQLTITEGTAKRTVELDLPQVLTGSVVYRHIAPEIQFRLELMLKDHRSVVETATFRP